MIVFTIVSVIVYILIMTVSYKFAEKIGNIFVAIGIIWAELAALYCFGSINGEVWITPLICGLISLFVALAMCYEVSLISKKQEEFRKIWGIYSKKLKKKSVAGILGIVLGSFGVHKFYLGKKAQGTLYLMFFYTWIPTIVGVIEGIRYLVMSKGEFDIYYNGVKPVYEQTQLDYDIQHGDEKLYLDNIIEAADTIKQNIEEDIVKNVIDEETVKHEDIPIKIGSASVDGERDDSIKIKIKTFSGQEYEFSTEGNAIVSFRASGQNTIEYKEHLR